MMRFKILCVGQNSEFVSNLAIFLRNDANLKILPSFWKAIHRYRQRCRKYWDGPSEYEKVIIEFFIKVVTVGPKHFSVKIGVAVLHFSSTDFFETLYIKYIPNTY